MLDGAGEHGCYVSRHLQGRTQTFGHLLTPVRQSGEILHLINEQHAARYKRESG